MTMPVLRRRPRGWFHQPERAMICGLQPGDHHQCNDKDAGRRMKAMELHGTGKRPQNPVSFNEDFIPPDRGCGLLGGHAMPKSGLPASTDTTLRSANGGEREAKS